jgi:hypothetical protein
MPCGDVRIKRLTAPVVSAEDAEKTAVFHYSKVDHVRATAPLSNRTGLRECNIITSHSRDTLTGLHAIGWRTKRAAGNGTV